MWPTSAARRCRYASQSAAALVASASVAALALVSCTTPLPSQPVDGPRLRLGVAERRPGANPQAGLAQLASLMREAALVGTLRDGRVQPALAERWTTSNDGLVWRFELREGLTFHDGSPVTAEAARASIAPGLAPSPIGLPPGLRDIVSVETASTRELVVRLRQPSALLLEALSLMPVNGGPEGDQGAGPYVVKTETGEGTTLEAFGAYFRGKPSISTVELRSFATPRTAWSAMLRGEIDFLYEVAPEAVEFVEAASDVRAFAFLRPYVYLVGFNLRHPVLGRRDVREALNLAVDRQLVIRRAFGGRGVPAGGPVWPRHWAHDSTVAAPSFDPARATALLDRAGLSPLASLAAARSRFAARLRFTCLVPADYPQFEPLALVVQKALVDVGVDMLIETLPLSELQRRLAEGRFDAYLLEMAAGPGFNWTYWFWHSAGDEGPAWIDSGYRGADAALDRLRVARDDAALRGAVRAFEQTLVDDPPAMFLGWGETARAVRRTFDVPAGEDRDVFSSLAQWRPAERGGRP